jgi:hypothetical protein
MGGYIFVFNWYAFFNNQFSSKCISWVPLLGGGLLAAGIWFSEFDGLRKYWWIVFLLDFGCLPGFIYNFLLFDFVNKLIDRFFGKK